MHKFITKDGYMAIYVGHGNHLRAWPNGCIAEHILIAEKALGKPLPVKAQVHHVNGVRSDNRNQNLVICEDQAYHNLLHRRADALRACGNADWRKCNYCKAYDDPAHLYIWRHNAYHRKCYRDYRRSWLLTSNYRVSGQPGRSRT